MQNSCNILRSLITTRIVRPAIIHGEGDPNEVAFYFGQFFGFGADFFIFF